MVGKGVFLGNDLSIFLHQEMVVELKGRGVDNGCPAIPMEGHRQGRTVPVAQLLDIARDEQLLPVGRAV